MLIGFIPMMRGTGQFIFGTIQMRAKCKSRSHWLLPRAFCEECLPALNRPCWFARRDSTCLGRLH